MAMSAFALDAVSGSPQYAGQMIRAALSALAGPPPSGRPLGAVSGVRPGTSIGTVSVSGMTAFVSPHSGILDVQASATAGPYLYAVTATEGVALNSAHATYTRWDRISIQISDPSQGDGTSTPGVAVVYTAGTPSASPAMPTAPPRSLTLARVVVPQSGGGSPSVVWLAPEWGGGSGTLQRMPGGLIQCGTASISITAANSGTISVTFPTVFASAPVVVCMIATATTAWIANGSSITAAGFIARAFSRDGTSGTATLPVTWIAMGAA